MVINKDQAGTANRGHYAANLDADNDEVYDAEFESLIERMLVRIGEDAGREGLRNTPKRVAKAMDFLTGGYDMRVEDVVRDAVFNEDCHEMVVVRDIEFYSLCEHHMLPFFGRAHVGYLPNGRVVGLSKVARIVDVFARRLQVQERLTSQIADALMEVLSPHGVAVVMEAGHTCMMMRGVQKQNSTTVTSAMRGSYEDNARSRAEFMGFLKN
jgi:GTP cyclohydrolase I